MKDQALKLKKTRNQIRRALLRALDRAKDYGRRRADLEKAALSGGALADQYQQGLYRAALMLRAAKRRLDRATAAIP